MDLTKQCANMEQRVFELWKCGKHTHRSWVSIVFLCGLHPSTDPRFYSYGFQCGICRYLRIWSRIWLVSHGCRSTQTPMALCAGTRGEERWNGKVGWWVGVVSWLTARDSQWLGSLSTGTSSDPETLERWYSTSIQARTQLTDHQNQHLPISLGPNHSKGLEDVR